MPARVGAGLCGEEFHSPGAGGGGFGGGAEPAGPAEKIGGVREGAGKVPGVGRRMPVAGSAAPELNEVIPPAPPRGAGGGAGVVNVIVSRAEKILRVQTERVGRLQEQSFDGCSRGFASGKKSRRNETVPFLATAGPEEEIEHLGTGQPFTGGRQLQRASDFDTGIEQAGAGLNLISSRHGTEYQGV